MVFASKYFSQLGVIRASTITRNENENLQDIYTPKGCFRGVPVISKELPENLSLIKHLRDRCGEIGNV